jgi:branched-chain amino acid transport system ATP-binding protein
MTPLLTVENLHGGYGGADILRGVDLTLQEGRIGVIAGPNGAGKSTLLKAIFGLVSITGGRIHLGDRDITGLPPEKLVRAGLSFVPQERNVFPSLTVRENLEMGAFIRRDDITPLIERVFEIFPPLREKAAQPAGELSGGQRQMVAMGRALMTEPRLLLLDEPTAGLSPKFMDEIFAQVRAVNAAGVTVLMVEQHARQALAIADDGFILAGGRNRHTGPARALLADPEVARSFLGG